MWKMWSKHASCWNHNLRCHEAAQNFFFINLLFLFAWWGRWNKIHQFLDFSVYFWKLWLGLEGLSFYGSQKGDEGADTDHMFQFCLVYHHWQKAGIRLLPFNVLSTNIPQCSTIDNSSNLRIYSQFSQMFSNWGQWSYLFYCFIFKVNEINILISYTFVITGRVITICTKQ